MRYGIVIDTENCMACYNCFMACKDEHCGFATSVSAPQPHEGQFWVRVEEKERGNDTRRIKGHNTAIPCSHCADAPCAKAAENGAVYTRPDGIVIIDPKKAAGQKKIAEACPLGAVYWNEELNLPQKCTMCAHLLDEGYAQPRCTEACPNEAMYFGDLDNPESAASKKLAEGARVGRITPLMELGGAETNVIYLNIPTVFLAGSVYLPEDEAADGASVTLTGRGGWEKHEVKTNYFGDWEIEWLTPGADYDIRVDMPGYKPHICSAKADTDRYIGEIILEKA
jgi:Fe-S-cluster-containing dehydrogenase component